MPTTLIVILVIPLALIFVLLAFVTLNRYIAYKERRAMAELGVSWDELRKDQLEQRRGNRVVLWGGVITTMSGLALLLGLSTLGSGAWLIAGLLPLFVGLGMVMIYFMTLGPVPDDAPRSGKKEEANTEQGPSPEGAESKQRTASE